MVLFLLKANTLDIVKQIGTLYKYLISSTPLLKHYCIHLSYSYSILNLKEKNPQISISNPLTIFLVTFFLKFIFHLQLTYNIVLVSVVATGMDFKGTVLSEISQTEKDKHHMISFTCGI